MAIEAKAIGNVMPPVEHLPPDPIRPEPELEPEPEPEPEMNRLDDALRLTALFLMLIASCSIISRVGPASGPGDEDLLAYGVFLFGVSLMFMSVMVAKSPLAAAFAALVVEFFHKFIFGDA